MASESKRAPSSRDGSKKGGFSLASLETLLGTTLPLSKDEKPLVKGTKRATPWGTFWSIRVVATKHGKVVSWGPDDATYADFPLLAKVIPRTFVVFEESDGSYREVICALPKFGSFTPGDADELGSTSSEVSTTTLAHPDLVTIRAEEKANGHTVVYRVFSHPTHGPLLVGGTKGCAWAFPVLPLGSLMGRLKAKETSFPTEKVFDAFCVMGSLILEDKVSLDLLTKQALVGERETNEHLRYYPDPSIVFFDQNLPPSVPKPKVLDLTITVKDLQDPLTILRFRSGGNHEGYVLVGYDKDHKVLWRLKLKTLSYTLERSLRELFRETDGLAVTLLKMKKVTLQRNLAFLHVDLDYLLTTVFDGFLKPLIEYLYAKGITKEAISHSTEGGGFAGVIQAFREASFREAYGRSDDFVLTKSLDEEGVKRSSLLLGEISSSLADLTKDQIVVATSRFLPGSGKSTWFAEAAERLGVSYHQALSQDDFGGDRSAFVRGLKEVLDSKTALVARCNFAPADRRALIQAIVYKPLLFLEPSPKEDPVLLVYAALKGLVKERPDHPTLGSTPLAKRLGILGTFYALSKPVRAFEMERMDHCEALPLPILDPTKVLPPPIYYEVESFMAIFKSKKRPPKTLPSSFDLERFRTMIEGGPELRVSPECLAERIEGAILDFRTRSSTPVLYISMDLVEGGGKTNSAYQALASFKVGFPSKRMQISADHVTLIFGPSEDQELSMLHLEDSVATTRGSRIYLAVDRSIAALAVDPPTTVVGGVPQTLPVASGVPHLTLGWDPSKRQAKDSAALIDGSLGPVEVFEIGPLELSGTIRFHYTLRPVSL